VWCLLASGLRVGFIGDYVIDNQGVGLSDLWVVPAMVDTAQCRIESDRRQGPAVKPADLGLPMPAALGARPETLLARLPTTAPWSELRYCVTVIRTPWDPSTYVLGPEEGRWLASIDARGMHAAELVAALGDLQDRSEPPERRLWRLVSVGLLRTAARPSA